LNSTVSTLIVQASLLVLTAIELNYKFHLQTYKVSYVTANGNLPAESKSAHLPATQTLPEKAFCIRRVISQNTTATLCNGIAHRLIIRRFAPTLALPRTTCRGGNPSSGAAVPLGGSQEMG
jgi:hypothetical protein